MSSVSTTPDGHYIIVDGRRWKATDPFLPAELVERLKSHLGRGRSRVRVAVNAKDQFTERHERQRVSYAKHGLGERGIPWWTMSEEERLDRANYYLELLEELGD